MSTNLYLTRPACPCCGVTPDPVHLGKFSGRAFIGRAYPTGHPLHPEPVTDQAGVLALARHADARGWSVASEYGPAHDPWTLARFAAELEARPLLHTISGEFS